MTRIGLISCLMGVFATMGVGVEKAKSQDSSIEFIDRDQAVGLIHHVKIRLVDEVDGNCWTHFNSIRANIRLKLERNDLRTIDYEMASSSIYHPYVTIRSNGFRTRNGTCFGRSLFQVSWYGSHRMSAQGTDKTFFVERVETVFERASIFANSNNLNQQIEDFYEGASSDFIAQILSARRNETVKPAIDVMPRIREKPMSRKEAQELYEDATND